MLIEALRKHAVTRPDRIAVVFGEQRLSYGELNRSVSAFASRLRAEGVDEGSFVCLSLPNGIDFVVSFFAVAAARGVAVPLEPGLTEQEWSRYLNGLPLSVVISEASSVPDCVTDCPVILVNEEPVATEPSPVLSYDGPVLCQFSSGSTGLPKRVVRTQRQLVREFQQLTGVLTLCDDDSVAAVVPLHHAHGFGNALLLALCNGLRLVIPRAPRDDDGRELPLRFWRTELLGLIEDELVSILPAVPHIFRQLADAPYPPEGLRLRLCISAGSPLDEDTFNRFLKRFNVPIRQLYGCTEAGSVTMNTDDHVESCWQSVGSPLPGVKLRMEGEEGVVTFRSGALAEGYFGEEASPEGAFNDGWFRTDDIGKIDVQGRLYIFGRRRPFIKSAGFKVDPREVEQVLCSHPGVAEAIVFGIPNRSVEELIKAVVVPKSGVSLNKSELIVLCTAQLAAYKHPRYLEIRDHLPRSPLGKVLIKELVTDTAS